MGGREQLAVPSLWCSPAPLPIITRNLRDSQLQLDVSSLISKFDSVLVRGGQGVVRVDGNTSMRSAYFSLSSVPASEGSAPKSVQPQITSRITPHAALHPRQNSAERYELTHRRRFSRSSLFARVENSRERPFPAGSQASTAAIIEGHPLSQLSRHDRLLSPDRHTYHGSSM